MQRQDLESRLNVAALEARENGDEARYSQLTGRANRVAATADRYLQRLRNTPSGRRATAILEGENEASESRLQRVFRFGDRKFPRSAYMGNTNG